jgi:DEAD/DEAH box helicase domain-containing protein
VYLYDNYPGGVGLSAPLFDLRQQVVSRASALVRGCDCSQGCPACIGPILASDEQRGYTPKRAALAVLDLFGAEDRPG